MTNASVYRFFDEAGALLYVGVSKSLPNRLMQHDRDKPWWRDVVRVEVEHFASRTEALEAEADAIMAEMPFWNIVHQPLQEVWERAIHFEPKLRELERQIVRMRPDYGDPEWCPERLWWHGENGYGHSGIYSRIKLLVGENRYTDDEDFHSRGPALWGLNPRPDFDDDEDEDDWVFSRPTPRPDGLFTIDEFCDQHQTERERRSVDAWLCRHDVFLEVVDYLWATMPRHRQDQQSCSSCGWYVPVDAEELT